MKTFYLIIILLFSGTANYISAQTVTPDANGILNVKKGSTGDVSSWSSPQGELADLLVAAKTNAGITQIWVAKGTYKTKCSPAENNFGNAEGNNNTFLMVANVKLYRGFEGTEANISQSATAQTSGSILSGDLNNNDLITGSGSALSISNNSENARFVVMAVGAMEDVTLDGFSVQGSYSLYNGSSPNTIAVNGNTVYFGNGSGIYINATEVSDTVAIKNYHFNYNDSANYSGGSLFVYNTESITVSNCIFEKNRYITTDG